MTVIREKGTLLRLRTTFGIRDATVPFPARYVYCIYFHSLQYSCSLIVNYPNGILKLILSRNTLFPILLGKKGALLRLRTTFGIRDTTVTFSRWLAHRSANDAGGSEWIDIDAGVEEEASPWEQSAEYKTTTDVLKSDKNSASLSLQWGRRRRRRGLVQRYYRRGICSLCGEGVPNATRIGNKTE